VDRIPVASTAAKSGGPTGYSHFAASAAEIVLSTACRKAVPSLIVPKIVLAGRDH